MNSKEYTLPNGKKAVFEYDVCGIGKVTLECMDELMAMIADRPQGEWINKGAVCQCTRCKGYSRGLLEEKNGKLCEPYRLIYPWFCPNCGAQMKGADDEH